jgi:polygalacturonase
MATQPTRRDFLKAAGVVAGGAAVTASIGTTLAHAAASPAAPDAATAPGGQAAAAADPFDAVPAILDRIKPPTFPAKDFPVTDFGAKADGKTDSTAAFAKAIAACNAAGGGRVVVRGGTFVSGAIHLLSNVNLFVDAGATVKFSTDPNRYLPVVFTRWQGVECFNYSAFVHADSQTNIAITGKGTLDGQGQSWKPFGSGGSDWQKLTTQAVDGVPVDQRRYGPGHKLRPNLIELTRCTGVLIADLTLLRPPMWTVHPVLSSNVTVRNLHIDSRGGGGNNDGVDPECCSDVHIVGCTFSTGDDCIAIKSGRDTDGRRVNVPSQNIVIEDCTFVFSNRGAICVGSEASGGANNIFARNCAVNPANKSGQLWYALFVKTGDHRGGTIDGVHLQNITANKLTKSALFVTMHYGATGNPGPVSIPTVRNLTFDRITVKGAGDYGVELNGLAQSHITNVAVTASSFTGTGKGNLHKSNADNVTGIK